MYVLVQGNRNVLIADFGTIMEVPPAHYVKFDFNKLCVTFHKYYTLPINHAGSYYSEEVDIQLHELLEKAVEKRMMSDREIGCLSGGLDSSIVASILQKNLLNLLKHFRLVF